MPAFRSYSIGGGRVRFLVALYRQDGETAGDLEALIEAGLLGAYRTGAASGVAAKALASSGLDAAKLFARAQDTDVKGKLLENTQSAVERGAFGSPTFFVGKEMFFGKEQLRDVEEMVTGS